MRPSAIGQRGYPDVRSIPLGCSKAERSPVELTACVSSRWIVHSLRPQTYIPMNTSSFAPRMGFVACVLISTTATSQVGRTVRAADYERAQKILAPALNGLVVGGSVAPTWLPDGRF